MLLINHSDIQFEIKKDYWIAQLIIEKISLEELNERNSLDGTEQEDKGFGLTGVVETPKIHILKRPEITKIAELSKPMAIVILPEKVDKQLNHKEKAKRQQWMNTMNPWMSQWLKKVVDSKDEEWAIKHVRSFIHESCLEQVTPKLIQQLREINKFEVQFMLHELQQKPRFIQCKRQSSNAFEVSAIIETPSGETFNIVTLLDSSCMGTNIDKKFAKEKGLKTYELPVPSQCTMQMVLKYKGTSKWRDKEIRAQVEIFTWWR